MTLKDAQEWAKEVIRQRYQWVEILFGKQESVEDKYCKACKAAKKDDCKNCDREIEEIRDDRNAKKSG